MLFLYTDKGFSRLFFVLNHEVPKFLEKRCIPIIESLTESFYLG